MVQVFSSPDGKSGTSCLPEVEPCRLAATDRASELAKNPLTFFLTYSTLFFLSSDTSKFFAAPLGFEPLVDRHAKGGIQRRWNPTNVVHRRDPVLKSAVDVILETKGHLLVGVNE
jgi:hypothetical protein